MSKEQRKIILDGLDFMWSEEKLSDVVALHNEGYHISDISKFIKRDPAEVLLALIHVALEKKVELRPLRG